MSNDLTTFLLSGKGSTKSYVVGTYLPPQDKLMTQLTIYKQYKKDIDSNKK